MSIANYSDLTTAVANWMARSDLTARIPEFIVLAEAKFNRNLSVRQMEQRSTTTVDTTQTSPEFVSLPSDFRSMRWVRLNGVTGKPHLDYMSPVVLDEYRTTTANATGQPKFFTIIASEIEICPSPDSNYTVEMVYRTYIPAIASNTTNWLLSLAPDLYLYGALVEASAYMQNDERVPLWRAGYQAAIDELSAMNRASSFGASPVAIRTSGPTP